MQMQMSKLRYLQAASAPGHVVAQRLVGGGERGLAVATAMFRPKIPLPIALQDSVKCAAAAATCVPIIFQLVFFFQISK